MAKDSTPKQKPEWEQLELIVADIQRQLAPDATVRHNHRVVGKSGRTRKLDISVSQKVGLYPTFIVFDCKRHTRAVSIGDVEAFAGQLRDVRANLGVMVSNSGFDAGAVAVAAQEGILLQTFRAAEKNDWAKFFGDGAWAFLTTTKFEILEVQLTLINGTPQPIPCDVEVYEDDGTSAGSVKSLFQGVYEQLPEPKPLGEVTFTLDSVPTPLFVGQGEYRLEVENFEIKVHLTSKRYAVHTQLAEGKILQDLDGDNPAYQQFTSESFRWRKIIEEQEGEDVDPLNSAQMPLGPSVSLKSAKEWLRFTLEVKPD
ncbi:MAG: hypothetical protein EOP04_20955 [Proteobacteria bacterium]|nr:MAG: hypothetical protein EOP04_20955 [Pseudomonadota bacterium]